VILLIATKRRTDRVSRLTFRWVTTGSCQSACGRSTQIPDALRGDPDLLRDRDAHPDPGRDRAARNALLVRAMLSFTIAHISVIRLRQKYRTKNASGSRGSVRMLASTFRSQPCRRLRHVRSLDRRDGTQPAHPGDRAGWMLRDRDLPALQTLAGDLSDPDHRCSCGGARVEEIEYESILVAFETASRLRGDGATAVKLASKRRRGIHVIAVVTVPSHLPLDASLAAGGGGPLEDRAGEADRGYAGDRPRTPGATEPAATRSRRRRES